MLRYGDVLLIGSSETQDECRMSFVFTQEMDENLYLNSCCFGFRLNDTRLLLPSFSKYLFRSEELRKQIKRTASGDTRSNVSKKKMAQVVLPLPPLSVQHEIVRILDNFTELTARKKQYEYYRDLLLRFDDDRCRDIAVSWLTLGEFANYRRGSFPQPYGERRWYGGENSMPFVQVADVAESGMRLNESTKQEISELAKPKSVFVPKGAVIVSLVMWIEHLQFLKSIKLK